MTSTRTSRGWAATGAPSRAWRYIALPPTFRAEYTGGTCWMTPMKRGSAASSTSRVGRASEREITSPSTSSVAVVMPKQTSAS